MTGRCSNKSAWKKTIYLLLAAGTALLIAACSSGDTQGTASQDSQQTYDWAIVLVSSKTADALNATKDVPKYNGDISQETVESKPREGCVYLLLKLEIQKQASGAANFEWKKLSIQDSSGNSYQRMENDTFLETFGYSRIKSTDLTLGKNEGFVCFEIKKESAAGGLELIYEDPQGENRIKIQ